MELILFQTLSYNVVFLNPVRLGGGEENANIIEALELWEIVVQKSLWLYGHQTEASHDPLGPTFWSLLTSHVSSQVHLGKQWA